MHSGDDPGKAEPVIVFDLIYFIFSLGSTKRGCMSRFFSASPCSPLSVTTEREIYIFFTCLLAILHFHHENCQSPPH